MTQPVPPSYASSPNAAERPMNIISIIGFICALVGLSLIGVILGHIGLSQIAKRDERGKGFAIAALILGYLGLLATIVIVILIVVAGGYAASTGVVTSY